MMGVVINITSCRTCVRLRVLLESRDYTCSVCDRKRIAALERRADILASVILRAAVYTLLATAVAWARAWWLR